MDGNEQRPAWVDLVMMRPPRDSGAKADGQMLFLAKCGENFQIVSSCPFFVALSPGRVVFL